MVDLANPAAAMMQGRQYAQQAQEMQRHNALQNLYQTQGAGIAAGDKNALAALAQFDPMAARTIQRQSTQDQYAAEDRDMRRQQFNMALEKHAATMTAQQRQAEAAQIEQAVAAGLSLPNPQAWDQYMSQNQPELVGQFDQREAIAAEYMSAADALKRFDDRNAGPTPLSPEGKLAADRSAGILPELDPDAPKPADFETEQKLRKEFLGVPAVKDFSAQQQAYGRIRASAQDPSPAGDMALIFNYMKLLDPGSVVRESEFALAAQSGSYGEQIQGLVSRIVNGERLADSVRSDFVNRSESLYADAEKGFANIENQYKSRASQYGLDPNRSLIDFRSTLDPYQAETPAADLSGISDEELMRMLSQ